MPQIDPYLSDSYLTKMNAYWRAANYLAAAQLYLLDNPLLREPLTMDHIKKKIVGHWGTVPGQNFVYTHLNRIINKYDLDMILISGPGHGGNFFVANSYLEGTYSEVYPNISQDIPGLKRLYSAGVVLHPQNHAGASLIPGDKRIHILHTDLRVGESLHRLGKTAGYIGNPDGDHIGEGNRQPGLPQDPLRLVRFIHDDAQNPEVGGIRDGEGADIDARARDNGGDLRQSAGLVLHKKRKLLDKHDDHPFPGVHGEW